MPSNWSKGQTKETNLSVKKISDTMKLRKIDNFKVWREKMKLEGKIRSVYPSFTKNGDLAELMGVVLGDGHISKFPRSEELTIFSNSSNKGFIKRCSKLVEKFFNKVPYVAKTSWSNCVRIRIYQKHISQRLGVPFSPRKNKKISVPRWILSNKGYVARYLRGLYEAEGSFCVHLPTSTYKFMFSNKNTSMLGNVFRLMKVLGFHPHWTKANYNIQISRKAEVYQAIKLLQFRIY
ncbi:MAG: hypothetical protein A3G47_02705 [Candidatus Zambryskibacteria bacterium RIFCSPLOWO2_12_FULL_39_45]|uniref:DOD-type homing endonuclease domain-containing protein n=3 Tax=Candidatus Zambryskiibacteriota TaxID=1817925 RepID=A0A1G2T8B8_9BACT|nr:MAG: hypothetical protein A2W58_03305 [Candidatus Zambryskibacteria bacterium RIFCSPHIGHO2_02_38_10.5]OHA97128.1 MAG: hypothetical protein A3C63_01425 [Candidatus Zambryskibacteria bacterium RIFCSPHIGHO2_02_FULL_39_82]OHA99284.1 MAG: hypothetical protein A3E32_02460 [Candidatus Zambryskibacteria bacterium RIFCSPHIGHO2_12_FULL_38_37]OHB09459.1 MAG: hypothetical protein A3I21_01245 [Candidatus Zambryskibacteria bacterium RIFCSPLOWO2_02_FULL_39_69]OHB12092.1 MAG: hypothetical protein A2Y49_0321